jgi:hypothetical protein
MTTFDGKSVKSPLQMVGFYLAWVESVMGAGLWAVRDVNDWTRALLIATMCGIGLIYAAVVASVLLYLVFKKPHFLFNPSDYTPAVQPMLFGQPELTVQNPPEKIL